MGELNTKTYYLIPDNLLTDQMIKDSIGVLDESTRIRSVRPIKSEFVYKNPGGKNKKPGYVLSIKFGEGVVPPSYMDKYRSYNNIEICETLNALPFIKKSLIDDIFEKYDPTKIKNDFDNENYLQVLGEVYIVVFGQLQFKFFNFNEKFLNDFKKWPIFRSHTLEGAKERAMSELNYFYDLITHDELKTIDTFRNIRNDLMHDNEHLHDKSDIWSSISSTSNLIEKFHQELCSSL